MYAVNAKTRVAETQEAINDDYRPRRISEGNPFYMKRGDQSNIDNNSYIYEGSNGAKKDGSSFSSEGI